MFPSESFVHWLPYHLAFLSLETVKEVVHHFGSLEAGILASQADWRASGLLSDKQWARFEQARGETQQAQRDEIENWAAQADQQIVTVSDPHYPSLLKEISDPPLLLYIKGAVSLLADPQLAMVGSRHASKAGAQVAEDFAQTLSSQGITVTSGLASGIDAAAHRGGLRGVGKTIAVMGTGIDRIYPAQHRALAHQIAEEGALVSEFPLGTRPAPFQFPKRNRIISGLSVGTLVVEAALKSGSLVTARLAMEQGREVFAIPGSIHNPQVKGCHQLIKQGAKLVETAQEVLEELQPLIQVALESEQETITNQAPLSASSEDTALSADEQKILKQMGYEPMSLDELIVLTKLPASQLQGQMMLLELAGWIESKSAGRWQRIK